MFLFTYLYSFVMLKLMLILSTYIQRFLVIKQSQTILDFLF